MVQHEYNHAVAIEALRRSMAALFEGPDWPSRLDVLKVLEGYSLEVLDGYSATYHRRYKEPVALQDALVRELIPFLLDQLLGRDSASATHADRREAELSLYRATIEYAAGRGCQAGQLRGAPGQGGRDYLVYLEEHLRRSYRGALASLLGDRARVHLAQADQYLEDKVQSSWVGGAANTEPSSGPGSGKATDTRHRTDQFIRKAQEMLRQQGSLTELTGVHFYQLAGHKDRTGWDAFRREDPELTHRAKARFESIYNAGPAAFVSALREKKLLKD